MTNMVVQFIKSIYPILSPDAVPPDNGITEMSCLVEKGGVYYLFYHSQYTTDGKFRIGVATATSPYGPFTKGTHNPIISSSNPAVGVACAVVVQDGGQWYMSYSQGSDVYLATPDLSGDWTLPWILPVPFTPILAGFGYPKSIVKVGSQYRMYAEYPVDAHDMGPIAMANAPAITGPWTKYAGNPVINYGSPGSWYLFGFAESGIFVERGIYKSFLTGTPLWTAILGRNTCIGYGESVDGITWTLDANPLVTPDNLGLLPDGIVYKYLSEGFTYIYTDLADGLKKYLVYCTVSTGAFGAEAIGVFIFTEGEQTWLPKSGLQNLPEGRRFPANPTAMH